jgi:hypothetical protein
LEQRQNNRILEIIFLDPPNLQHHPPLLRLPRHHPAQIMELGDQFFKISKLLLPCIFAKYITWMNAVPFYDNDIVINGQSSRLGPLYWNF